MRCSLKVLVPVIFLAAPWRIGADVLGADDELVAEEQAVLEFLNGNLVLLWLERLGFSPAPPAERDVPKSLPVAATNTGAIGGPEMSTL